MEYFETNLGNYKKFLDHIRLKILYSVTQSIDNDYLYTPGKLTLKLTNIIKEMSPSAENMLNDLYIIINPKAILFKLNLQF